MKFNAFALCALFSLSSFVNSSAATMSEPAEITLSAQELKLVHAIIGIMTLLAEYCPLQEQSFLNKGVYNSQQYPYAQKVLELLNGHINGNPEATEKLQKFISEINIR